jgi:quercetin dioxygenase-like cupin family protein
MTDTASATRPLTTAELETVVCLQAREAQPLGALGNDTGERNGMRVFRTPDYDVWLLRWPPGSRVTPHDHGDSAGAFVVVDGELIELRWQGSIPECRLVGAGETTSFERGVVHDVVATNRVAYSLHAYSPPLQAMSFYDVPAPAPQVTVFTGPSGNLSLVASPALVLAPVPAPALAAAALGG